MEDVQLVTLIVGVISAFVTSGAGVITWLVRRDMAKLRVRLAEVEAKKEIARGDDANMAIALQLATHLATTLSPLRISIDNLTAVSNQVLEKNDNYLAVFTQKADEMHAVVQRRDQERDADLKHHDQLHGELIDRFDRQQAQLETLTREIKVRDLPPEVRGDISKLLLLISNMGADVKTILAMRSAEEKPADSPETNQPAAEAAPVEEKKNE